MMATWRECTTFEFATRAAGVVVPYGAPPERTVVNCVDEMPSIAVPVRAQSYLQLTSARRLRRRSASCKRNSISTLSAALGVAADKVSVAHIKRYHRVEFLGFMNGFVAPHPSDTATHVALDKLSPQEPHSDRWPTRYPNVRFYPAPTRASWFDRVEI